MTRSLNGANSGTVYIDEDIEFHQQVVLEDKFLFITWYRPERNWETSSGVGWMAEHANKTIIKGNFSYKDGILHAGTITENANFSISRMQDGSLKETAYGYEFEELPYLTNNNNVFDDNTASGVSFSYSNDPTKTYHPETSPKLASFPISNDRSVIKTSGFSQFVQEGWLDNPFHSYTGITIAALNDSYIPDSNGLSSVCGEAPVKITSYEAGEETTLDSIKDYDGNLHAGDNSAATPSSYKYQGLLDVNGDGAFEAIFTNKSSKRWVTAEVDSATGQIDFDDHGAGGTTRVVGIYIDPLVTSGEVEQFGPHDSQRRFQNDLKIDNLIAKTSGDYDGDGFQEVYWKTNDNTAYLRALMHADGNIQYANYQSKEQMSDYLTAQGHEGVIAEIISNSC